MRKGLTTIAITIGLVSCFAINSNATLINVVGGNSLYKQGSTILDTGVAAQIIAAPLFALDDNVTNRAMQGFDEVQSYLTTVSFSVDGGTIAAGTWVDSHMIFLNSEGNTRYGHYNVDWTFDGKILGIMSNSNGSYEVNSTSFLGSPTTTYPLSTFSARGLENQSGPGEGINHYGFNHGWDGYDFLDDYTLRVGMTVTEPGDWIRVITAASPVPEPTTMLLFGAGLAGLAGIRRRK